MKFSEQLKSAMALQHITQKELAVSTGLSQAAISQYLHDKGTPRPEAKAALSKCLKVNFLEESESCNVSIDEAAKILNCSKQFLRVSLQRGIVDFGFAIKISGNRFTYHISRKKLLEYAG